MTKFCVTLSNHYLPDNYLESLTTSNQLTKINKDHLCEQIVLSYQCKQIHQHQNRHIYKALIFLPMDLNIDHKICEANLMPKFCFFYFAKIQGTLIQNQKRLSVIQLLSFYLAMSNFLDKLSEIVPISQLCVHYGYISSFKITIIFKQM